MAIKNKMKKEFQSYVFDTSVLNDISNKFENQGYSLKHNSKSEIVVNDCKKNDGYNIIESVLNIPKKKIKYAFNLVCLKDRLFIRKKYCGKIYV